MYFIPSSLVLLLKSDTFYNTTSSMNTSNQDMTSGNHKDFIFENADNFVEEKQGRHLHFSKERYLIHKGKTWGSPHEGVDSDQGIHVTSLLVSPLQNLIMLGFWIVSAKGSDKSSSLIKNPAFS